MDKSGFLDNDIHSRGEIQLRKGATEGRGDNPKRRAFEEICLTFRFRHTLSAITLDVSLLQYFNMTPDTRGV